MKESRPAVHLQDLRDYVSMMSPEKEDAGRMYCRPAKQLQNSLSVPHDQLIGLKLFFQFSCQFLIAVFRSAGGDVNRSHFIHCSGRLVFCPCIFVYLWTRLGVLVFSSFFRGVLAGGLSVV